MVRVTNAKVKLGGTAMQGKALTIPLPTVEIRDIGKEKEGASIAQAVTRVLKAVVASAAQAVGSVVGSVGDVAGAAGDAALKGATAVGSAAAKGAGDVAQEAMAAGEAVGNVAGKLFSGAASRFEKKEEQTGGVETNSETSK